VVVAGGVGAPFIAVGEGSWAAWCIGVGQDRVGGPVRKRRSGLVEVRWERGRNGQNFIWK
jgi:hypothetical protein